MEESPSANKINADRKESREPTSRKPEAIGSLAVKPKSAERDDQERSPEVGALHSMQQAPEHIGHMLMSADEPEPQDRADKSKAETTRPAKVDAEKPAERPSQPLNERRVDTLSRAELLALSETIVIDGGSLRQIYETHLIGERGLRRLVAEHLRGGDLKKALRREIIEREIDFERDPILRDMVPQEPGSSSNTALDKLLERATINLDDNGEETAFFKARATYEANQLEQHKNQRRVIDFSLAGVIVILVALVIILYLSRR